MNGPAPPGRIRSSNPPGVGTGVIPASSQANSPKGLRRPPRTPQFRAIGVRRGEEKPAGEAGAPERALKARDRLVGGRVGVEGEDVPRCGDDRGRSEGLRRFSVRNTSMAASVSLLPIPRATRRRILGSIIVARQNVPFSSASESPFFTLVADVRPEGVPLPLIQMMLGHQHLFSLLRVLSSGPQPVPDGVLFAPLHPRQAADAHPLGHPRPGLDDLLPGPPGGICSGSARFHNESPPSISHRTPSRRVPTPARETERRTQG